MSPTKKDRPFQSRRDPTIPHPDAGRIGAGGFAAEIAAALRRDYGDHRSAIKTIVRLTSANERAVKNWYEGRNGPSGELLVVLCRHSDEVLETVLGLAGRSEIMKTKRLKDAKRTIKKILRLLDEV